jgi:hypothetical protein
VRQTEQLAKQLAAARKTKPLKKTTAHPLQGDGAGAGAGAVKAMKVNPKGAGKESF